MTYTVRDLIAARLKEKKKKKEKPYKPELGFKKINGIDIIVKTEVGKGFEILESELADMRRKNEEMFRTLNRWNEIAIILKTAFAELKQLQKEEKI